MIEETWPALLQTIFPVQNTPKTAGSLYSISRSPWPFPAPIAPVFELHPAEIERRSRPDMPCEVFDNDEKLILRKLRLHLVDQPGGHYEIAVLFRESVVEADMPGVCGVVKIDDDARVSAPETVCVPVVCLFQGLDTVFVAPLAAHYFATARTIEPVLHRLLAADEAFVRRPDSQWRLAGAWQFLLELSMAAQLYTIVAIEKYIVGI